MTDEKLTAAGDGLVALGKLIMLGGALVVLLFIVYGLIFG